MFPRMHSTLLTSHFFSSFMTSVASRKAPSLAVLVTTREFLGRGKKSTRSTTPSSMMYRVWRILEDGRYCCLVVKVLPCDGLILKKPPMSLSRRRQKTEGESKSGLKFEGHTELSIDSSQDREINTTRSAVESSSSSRTSSCKQKQEAADIPAHEVHAAIDSHQGTGMHVPNQTVVLNGEVSSVLPAHRAVLGRRDRHCVCWARVRIARQRRIGSSGKGAIIVEW